LATVAHAMTTTTIPAVRKATHAGLVMSAVTSSLIGLTSVRTPVDSPVSAVRRW
jgi:hypothetical protein